MKKLALTFLLAISAPGYAAQIFQNGVSYYESELFGAEVGKEFHDGFLPEGKRVAAFVVHSGADFDGLQLIYEDNQGLISSSPFNGTKGGKRTVIWLASGEYLTDIYGVVFDEKQISNIIIKTNKTHYNFGGPNGQRKIRISAPEGFEIVGFHGRADRLVNQIGLISRRK